MTGFSDNMGKRRFLLIASAFLLLLLSTFFLWESGALYQDKIDFNAEVRPILNKKCITCHGGVKRSGEFSLLFRSVSWGLLAMLPDRPSIPELF